MFSVHLTSTSAFLVYECLKYKNLPIMYMFSIIWTGVKEHITGLLASEAYSDMSFCFILFFIVKVNKGFLMLLWQLLHPFNEFHSFIIPMGFNCRIKFEGSHFIIPITDIGFTYSFLRNKDRALIFILLFNQ